MKDVTEALKQNEKRIAKFKKLKRVSEMLQTGEAEIKTTQGRMGGTLISDNLCQEFYLWLSEATRQQILNGVRWQDIDNNQKQVYN